MLVSEVLDIETSGSNSVKLEAGDKITVQGFLVKHVESTDADVAERSTSLFW